MKIFLVILYFLIACFGEELDKDSRKALEEVQKLLTDPALRQQAIQGDAKAQKADNFAREVVGNNPKALEELFSIVSSVMESMVKKHGGDVPKMNQVMMEFKKSKFQIRLNDQTIKA